MEQCRKFNFECGFCFRMWIKMDVEGVMVKGESNDEIEEGGREEGGGQLERGEVGC